MGTFLDKLQIAKGMHFYSLLNQSSCNINVLDISTLIPIKIEKYNLDRNNYYTNSKGELIKYYEKKYEIIKTKGILFIQLYRNSGIDKS